MRLPSAGAKNSVATHATGCCSVAYADPPFSSRDAPAAPARRLTRDVTDMGRHFHHISGLLCAVIVTGAPGARFKTGPRDHGSALNASDLSTRSRARATGFRRPEPSPHMTAAYRSGNQCVTTLGAQAARIPKADPPQPVAIALTLVENISARRRSPTTSLQLDREFARSPGWCPSPSTVPRARPAGYKAVAELVPIAHEAREVAIRGRTDATGSVHQWKCLPGHGGALFCVCVCCRRSPGQEKFLPAEAQTFCGDQHHGRRRLNRRVDVEMHLSRRASPSFSAGVRP